jgi:phosphonoacetate hydrolase
MPMSLMPRLRLPFESISPCTQCHPGVRVAAVTAKDKLRRILGHGLAGSGAICFSAKYAGSCSVKENGIDDVEAWVGRAQPSQYSGDLSLFVLDAGIKILEEKRADLLYLTLSDYIQHKHAPGQKESDEFLAALDQRLKDLVDLGAVVAVTGDHGMSDKCLPDGKPNVSSWKINWRLALGRAALESYAPSPTTSCGTTALWAPSCGSTSRIRQTTCSRC